MFYSFMRACFRCYFKLLYRCRVHGLENIPTTGAFIICSNHTSWFDPPLVGSMMPRKKRVYFMAKEELFSIFVLGRAIKKLGAFPVKRDTADRKAIAKALQVLEEGKVLGLFPEGTRVKTGDVAEPFQGPAFLALKSKKPVLPVRIKWPSRYFKTLQVCIGKPLVFKEEGEKRKEMLNRISMTIMQEIHKLHPESREEE